VVSYIVCVCVCVWKIRQRVVSARFTCGLHQTTASLTVSESSHSSRYSPHITRVLPVPNLRTLPPAFRSSCSHPNGTTLSLPRSAVFTSGFIGCHLHPSAAAPSLDHLPSSLYPSQLPDDGAWKNATDIIQYSARVYMAGNVH